jgi:hypothetical protein
MFDESSKVLKETSTKVKKHKLLALYMEQSLKGQEETGEQIPTDEE